MVELPPTAGPGLAMKAAGRARGPRTTTRSPAGARAADRGCSGWDYTRHNGENGDPKEPKYEIRQPQRPVSRLAKISND